jgi:hypothetical protein
VTSDKNVGDMAAKYSSNPAKFRDLISEINTKLIWPDVEH